MTRSRHDPPRPENQLGSAPATGGPVLLSNVVSIGKGKAGAPLVRPRRQHRSPQLGFAEEVLQGANWITFASWKPGQVIAAFESSWRVPQPPTGHDDQLLYLFNGLQNEAADQILQPVLQWGVSPCGGDNSWNVIPVFVQPSIGIQKPEAGLVAVAPGTLLTGYIRLISEAGGRYRYECGFRNIPEATLTVENADPLVEAVEVLEAYNVARCEDYPDQTSTTFSAPSAAGVGGPLQAAWSKTDRITDCGQHSLLSPGGEVDIHYRTA